MKLTFVGADHEVTGSCHYIDACGKHMLVDYGMEQGSKLYENIPIPVSAAEIDYVFLTHAHIDHSGLLPLLFARGFRGKVYATEGTCDLANIMLRDSAHIQVFEAEWRNRKARRSSLVTPYEPLYTMQDADGVISLLNRVRYNTKVNIDQGIEVRFTDVGHLLGSSAVEMWLTEDSVTKKIVFSGDIGNPDQPILKDPMPVEEADYVLVESTYGDRLHTTEKVDYVAELTKIIQRTFDRGGNVVIPSFAVGRTQEMLYFIRKIKEDNLIKYHDDFQVYVDSPLAVEATSVFSKNQLSCYDEEAIELVKQGINPIDFPGLNLSITPEESKEINFDDEPKVIISASGMCEAGRIRHHLKHNLWRDESTILFVGYQAVGTLGRALVEGSKDVKLFGEPVEVRAEIATLAGISGHADKNGLLSWMKGFKEKPDMVFVVHGEDRVTEIFADTLQDEMGLNAYAPFSGTVFNLLTNEFEVKAKGVAYEKKAPAAAARISAVFARLLGAGERLMAVIRKNEHGANKDLAKFTSQINDLADKWDRK
ncbi:MAG: MBL fold metallo-hydrolase [Lachnospiraceae bacterium]|nr:MBL fold metallo-hydrolase [Lachnospiraceae bacterium]